MKSARRRTNSDDPLYIKEDHRAIFHCQYIIQKHTAFWSNIRFAEHFSCTDHLNDTAIFPVVITLNMKFSLCKHQYCVDVFSLTENISKG